MEKDIYKLKLHETAVLFGISIMRVPGGWFYDCWDLEKDEFKKGTFVKFDNEFQKKPQTELFPKEEAPKFNFKKSLIELPVEEKIASEWLEVRRGKAKNTETAFNRIVTEIEKTKAKPNDCIKMAVEYSWKGFEAEWYFNKMKKTNDNEQPKKLTGKF
jgi:hypothetical protein